MTQVNCTDAQKALLYGVGVYVLHILFSLADIFIMTVGGDWPLAVTVATFALYVSIVLNYKKYALMKQTITLSFFRVVIFDSVVMALSYIYIIMANSEGYLDLWSCVFPALTMLPLIITNKKIKPE